MGQYKAFNFDLDTNKLKQYYTGAQYQNAYIEIRKFMEENGFEHRQGSGYISKQKLEQIDVLDIVMLLKTEFTWITKCVKQFDVTNIGQQFDLTFFLVTETTEKEIKPLEKQDVKKKKTQGKSR